MVGLPPTFLTLWVRIYQDAYDPILTKTGKGLLLHYECLSWARSVRGLCGIPYTTRSWKKLYLRGQRLSTRLDTYLKDY